MLLLGSVWLEGEADAIVDVMLLVLQDCITCCWLKRGDYSGHISTPLQSSLLPCNLTAVARPPPSTLPHTCAQDGAEMRDAIKARCPSKIDIGPVYSCNPKDRLKFGSECGGGVSVERE